MASLGASYDLIWHVGALHDLIWHGCYLLYKWHACPGSNTQNAAVVRCGVVLCAVVWCVVCGVWCVVVCSRVVGVVCCGVLWCAIDALLFFDKSE